LEPRESDIIYKLKTENVYFYCLMELQSSVDYTMLIRLMVYMSSLWQNILKETDEKERNRKDYKLPVIVPIVLYNGDDKWTVGQEFSSMYANYELFKDYALNFKYYLLDVNRYSDEDLVKAGNLVSSILLLDKKPTDKGRMANEVAARLGEALPILRTFTAEEANIFLRWFKSIALPRLVGEGESGRGSVEEMIEAFSEETEMGHYVSNFALGMEALGKRLRDADQMELRIAEKDSRIAEDQRRIAEDQRTIAELRRQLAAAQKRAA
jgi:hypothetical protein